MHLLFCIFLCWISIYSKFTNITLICPKLNLQLGMVVETHPCFHATCNSMVGWEKASPFGRIGRRGKRHLFALFGSCDKELSPFGTALHLRCDILLVEGWKGGKAGNEVGAVVRVAPHRVPLHLQRLQPHQALQLDQGAEPLDLIVGHVELLQAGHRLQTLCCADPVPPGQESPCSESIERNSNFQPPQIELLDTSKILDASHFSDQVAGQVEHLQLRQPLEAGYCADPKVYSKNLFPTFGVSEFAW